MPQKLAPFAFALQRVEKEEIENGIRKKVTMLREENVLCDGLKCTISLYDDCIKLTKEKENDSDEDKITWDDVLKIETNVFDGKKGGEPAFTLHYIHKLGKVKGDGKGIRWKHVKKDFTAEEAGVAEKLGSHMSKLFDQKVSGRPRRLLMLINPRSGNGKAESVYNKEVEPLMTLMDIQIQRKLMEGVVETRNFLNEFDYSTVDGVVVMGGDGSMADVINTFVLRAQREANNDVNRRDVKVKPVDVKLGILPAGSGQCDTLVLNGSTDAETAALHIIKGETIDGDLITCHNGDTWVYSGIVGGGVGYFADLLVYAEAKRWLGTLRYLVGFVQALYYLGSFDAEIEVQKEQEGGGDEWEKVSGRFLEVGIYPRGIGHGMGFPGFMEVVLQREASRRQVMSFVSKFVAADPALADFPHVQTFRARAVRVRLPHIVENDPATKGDVKGADGGKPEAVVGSAVHVDGELFPLTTSELTFKLHRNVVTFFGIERDADEIVHQK